jgi:hypothetical protein
VVRQLSERETAVLTIIETCSARGNYGATGVYLTRAMINDHHLDTSPSGAHRTAAALVRKNLAWRTGITGQRAYKITQPGRDALRRDHSGQWIARAAS